MWIVTYHEDARGPITEATTHHPVAWLVAARDAGRSCSLVFALPVPRSLQPQLRESFTEHRPESSPRCALVACTTAPINALVQFVMPGQALFRGGSWEGDRVGGEGVGPVSMLHILADELQARLDELALREMERGT